MYKQSSLTNLKRSFIWGYPPLHSPPFQWAISTGCLGVGHSSHVAAPEATAGNHLPSKTAFWVARSFELDVNYVNFPDQWMINGWLMGYFMSKWDQIGSNWLMFQKWKVTQRTPWDSKPTRSVKIVFLWQRSIFVFFLMFSFGMYFGVFSKSAYSSCLYTTIEFNAGWSFQSILKLLANWGSSSRFQTCEGWKFKIL